MMHFNYLLDYQLFVTKINITEKIAASLAMFLFDSNLYNKKNTLFHGNLEQSVIHCNMKKGSKNKLSFFSSLIIMNQLTALRAY